MKRDETYGLHHKVGVGLFGVWLYIIAAGVAQHAGAGAWQSISQTRPVMLWKAREVSLAELTPGCDVLDWGCVISSAKQ